ncbi:MAG: hypothetical protein ABJP70_10610 [Erythrobacter sp.]
MLRPKKVVAPETSDKLSGHALIAQTLFAREKAGQTTTLRQLHQITQITQPAALRILAYMQRTGEVTVEEVIHDTFESTIVLSKKKREILKLQRINDAA